LDRDAGKRRNRQLDQERTMTRARAKIAVSLVLLAMLVVTIIGTAAWIFLGLRQPLGCSLATNEGQAKLKLDLFTTAIDCYQIDIGSYPSTAAGLQALRKPPVDLADPSKWNGPYIMKDIPLDPWGKPYQYACPGRHDPGGFDVWTVTPDNEEIGNWDSETKKPWRLQP
jgi:general secretion pathway protein G